jgi:predicted ATP-binding protein involved in virulence
MNIEKKSKAVEKLEENAEKGEVLSAFQLFENYRDGKFVLQDDAMAAQYLAQCFEYLQELDEHKTLKNRFRLEKLDLVDFRRFERLEVKLHPELTVLIGDNGSGKTSILEAISKTLSNVTNEVLKGASGRELSRFDVNNSSDDGYADVVSAFHYGSGVPHLRGQLSVAQEGKPKSKPFLEELRRIGQFWQWLDKHYEINLPIMAYYSDKRNCHEKVLKRQEDRFDAYREAFDDLKAFGYFMAWYIRLHKKALSADVLAKTYLDYIEAVICSSIHTKTIRLDMSTGEDIIWFKTENTEEVRFEQLSAGQKAVTTLFGDIARRLILLNPKLDNPLEGQGIVLIDEIELHLHPKWQQGVLLNLQKSFPNIQFIVTTHSPQVLSTVKRESIRVLSEDFAQKPLAETYGHPSGDVLHAVMSVNSTPATIPEIEGLKLLTRWVDQGFYADKKTIDLMQDLEEKLGRAHPQLSMLRRNIERQKVLNQ